MKEEYCFHCMESRNPSEPLCPNCGMVQEHTEKSHHLMMGTVLNRKYLVGTVLGEGGFGITYIGRDLTLDMKVAVKEYYPCDCAERRHGDSQDVFPLEGREEAFEKGKDQYLKEARTLAKFPYEDGIVGVRDFFQENNTGYIVMEYLEGITLKSYLETVPRISFQKTLKMMLPVMNSLEKVHEAGVIHRDISPENIMITMDGKVKLLDFGASRDIRQKNRDLTVVLKPSYAPEEQYSKNGIQGPWTDVYALCATIYRCITGIMPEDSVSRVLGDEVKAPSELGIEIGRQQESALLKGMAVHAKNRFRSMAELKAALEAEIPEEVQAEIHGEIPTEIPAEAPTEETTVVRTEKRAEPGRDGTDNRGITSDTGEGVPKEQMTIMPSREEHPRERLDRTVFLTEEKPGSPERAEIKNENDMDEKALSEPQTPLKEKIPSKEKIPAKSKKHRLKFIVPVIIAVLAAVVVFKMNSEVVIGSNKYPVLSNQEVKVCENDVKLTVSQIKALKKIKNLTNVDFYECMLTDREVKLLADVLEHKTAVKSISLTGNPEITDISPLSKLESLTWLNISSTSVRDLTPVSSLKELSNLYIQGLGISDLEFLYGMEKMRLLYAEENDIEDLTPLKNLPVSSLYLDDNRIKDISVLKDKEKISLVLAANNQISDISALADKKELVNVGFSGNQISDVTALRGDTALRYIYLDGNEIEDISSWQYLRKVHTLLLRDNRIQDIGVLAGMKDLDTLDLKGNRIEDISALSGLQNLKAVDLSNNKISDLSPLEGHAGLNPLLAGNQIHDLTPLPTFYSLPAIDLSNNQIEDLTVLETMSGLKVLDLHGNPVTDFTPLSGLESIELLVFTYQKGMDLQQIKELPFGSYDKIDRIVICDVPEEEKLAVEDLFADSKIRLQLVTTEEWEGGK